MHKGLLVVLMAVAGAAGAAGAQTTRHDPADPKAQVPVVEHRSALEGYRRYAEPQISGWRELNDEAARIGGHLGILRGQGQASKPAPKPHAGHK